MTEYISATYKKKKVVFSRFESKYAFVGTLAKSVSNSLIRLFEAYLLFHPSLASGKAVTNKAAMSFLAKISSYFCPGLHRK